MTGTEHGRMNNQRVSNLSEVHPQARIIGPPLIAAIVALSGASSSLLSQLCIERKTITLEIPDSVTQKIREYFSTCGPDGYGIDAVRSLLQGIAAAGVPERATEANARIATPPTVQTRVEDESLATPAVTPAPTVTSGTSAPPPEPEPIGMVVEE